jgi:hypothetical protein
MQWTSKLAGFNGEFLTGQWVKYKKFDSDKGQDSSLNNANFVFVI